MKFGCSAAICLRAPSALRDCQFALFAESRFTPIITSDTLQGDQQVDLQMNWAEDTTEALVTNLTGDREVTPSNLARGLV